MPVVFPIIYVAIIVGGNDRGGRCAARSRGCSCSSWRSFPLLWGAFPVSGVIGEGRYVMFILPAVTLLLVYAARHPVFQVLLLVAALAVSVEGVHRIRCCTSPARARRRDAPATPAR